MGKSFKFKFQKPGNQNVKTIDDEFYQHTGKPSFKIKELLNTTDNQASRISRREEILNFSTKNPKTKI